MRILVVEDDQILNQMLCYNLNAASMVEKEGYDLLILDVNLPDGDGFAFCREVKKRFSDLPVIFLTAKDMESDMLKGYELGADDYVTKPFHMSVFQKKVSVVLSRTSKKKRRDYYDDGTLFIDFRK